MSFQRAFQVARQVLTVALAGLAGMTISAASPADQASLVAANNQFAFDLMQQVVLAHTNANDFLSPFNAATALQMVANGAAGQTKTEIQQVLHTIGMTDATLNESFQTLNQSFTSRSNVTLTLANGLWVQPEFPLKPDFVAENHQYFGAELAALDFNLPASAQTINDWASRQTHGKIPEIVQYPFDPHMRLILASAIYFKGKWVTEFAKSMTIQWKFNLPGGETKSTPMMKQKQKYDYEETESYQAVRLPYKGGLRMTVFLPAVNHNPLQLLHTFGRDGFWQKNIQPAFENLKGTVSLPKFKIEFGLELNTPLKELGMRTAFEKTDANFSGISEKPVFVSAVKQKSCVEVNEEGTEAADVSSLIFSTAGIDRNAPKKFYMYIDRPFLFTIEDEATGAILFMGIINNPETD